MGAAVTIGVITVCAGDSNEVSDEGVPCALPLLEVPFAIGVT